MTPPPGVAVEDIVFESVNQSTTVSQLSSSVLCNTQISRNKSYKTQRPNHYFFVRAAAAAAKLGYLNIMQCRPSVASMHCENSDKQKNGQTDRINAALAHTTHAHKYMYILFITSMMKFVLEMVATA